MLARRVAIAAIVVSILVVGSLLSVPEDGTSEETYLFVLNAKSGTLELESDGSHTLTLIDMSDITLAFADRPIRQAHIMSTADFVSSYDMFFGDNPPNAALSFMLDDDATEMEMAVFIISNPRYDADNKILTYSATLIPLDGVMEGVSSEDTPLSELPARFGHSSMLIDSTNVKIRYVNKSMNPDEPSIIIFDKNEAPTDD